MKKLTVIGMLLMTIVVLSLTVPIARCQESPYTGSVYDTAASGEDLSAGNGTSGTGEGTTEEAGQENLLEIEQDIGAGNNTAGIGEGTTEEAGMDSMVRM